jgi:hypothetical protein
LSQVAGQDAAGARFAAGHGPYAKAAREELSMPLETDAPIEVKAANTNTAPSSAVASVQPAAQDEDVSPVIVPLPVRPRPATGSAPQFAAGTERPQAGVATDGALHPVPDGQEMVDVLVSRETARFRVPVSKATLPVTLFPAQEDGKTPALAGGGAAETPAADLDDVSFAASSEDEPDGLARLAGRLRPALPGAS